MIASSAFCVLSSMSLFKSFVVAFCLISLFACAAVQKPQPEFKRVYLVTWYGGKFQGKRTASGEIFNKFKRTAAHRKLPFGTRLKLTNIENGRSTTVTINDRGPANPAIELDISYAAAKDLGMLKQGVARVTIEYAGDKPLRTQSK